MNHLPADLGIPYDSVRSNTALDELCGRWGLTHQDVAAFVLAKELAVSVVVIGVRVEYGHYEVVDPFQTSRVPKNYENVTGLADLEPVDAWRLIREERQSITRFKPKNSDYAEIDDSDCEDGLNFLREDVVVRLEEVERFELVHGLSAPVALAPPPSASVRGVPSRYDWEAFWIELCRSIYVDGLPGSQAELVRQMRDWFETTGSVPDDSTIKKKLSPLWRALHAADLRQSA